MSAQPEQSEFYVGYLPKAPQGLARHARTAILAAGVITVVVTIAIAAMQNPVDRGTFEFGVQREFAGVLRETPLPMLRVTAPHPETGELVAYNLILVGFGKHGLPEFARGHDGERVTFRGSLVYRDNMTMVEMNDAESFRSLGLAAAAQTEPVEVAGNVTLVGEIVDTKCYLGVMRPATGKVHRACAIRCLEGGVPPGLLVRDEDGNSTVFMLAGQNGRPLDLDSQWAALTARTVGKLELHDELPVLRVESLELVPTGH